MLKVLTDTVGSSPNVAKEIPSNSELILELSDLSGLFVSHSSGFRFDFLTRNYMSLL